MKKILLLLTVTFMGIQAYAQSNVTIVASTKGMAPIPSFIRDEPASILFASIHVAKHWTLDPDYAFSLKNGKPWFSDIWAHYYVHAINDTTHKWNFIAGFDPSLFFQPGLVTGYPTGEGKITFNPNTSNGFTLDYQYLLAVPHKDGASGSYLSFVYSGTIETTSLLFNATPNVFYLKFTDGTDGTEASIDLSIAHKKSGLKLGFQAVHPIAGIKADLAKGLYIAYTKNF